jgi:hypothetical protein
MEFCLVLQSHAIATTQNPESQKNERNNNISTTNKQKAEKILEGVIFIYIYQIKGSLLILKFRPSQHSAKLVVPARIMCLF